MQEPRVVHIGNLSLANNQKIKLIAGPCALESKEHAFEMAGALTELAKTFGIGLIYKTSYDKANRTSVDAKRGLGIEESLPN
ncbi:MAG TPA: 3-deoxy-8-phosphooctulonate synthase, partial [Rhodospirillales bacterium]|nr:3-deoxy-8-phosphooctulonate synthase [Rhodospirillales bacterium]